MVVLQEEVCISYLGKGYLFIIVLEVSGLRIFHHSMWPCLVNKDWSSKLTHIVLWPIYLRR